MVARISCLIGIFCVAVFGVFLTEQVIYCKEYQQQLGKSVGVARVLVKVLLGVATVLVNQVLLGVSYVASYGLYLWEQVINQCAWSNWL